MVCGDDYFSLFNHCLEKEDQHAFSYCSCPCDFCVINLTGEEFVKVIRKCIFGNPADLDEFLAEHVDMTDGYTTHRERDVGAVLLDWLFWLARFRLSLWNNRNFTLRINIHHRVFNMCYLPVVVIY